MREPDVAAVAAQAGARSAEIERARTLPADLVEDLAATGVFRLWVPADLGGVEADVATGLGVIEDIAYHDGSTGWCVMIAMTTGLLGAFLLEEHARAIYGAAGAVTGGFAAPVGRATTLDGGGPVSYTHLTLPTNREV